MRYTEPGHWIRAGKGVNLSGASRDSNAYLHVGASLMPPASFTTQDAVACGSFAGGVATLARARDATAAHVLTEAQGAGVPDSTPRRGACRRPARGWGGMVILFALASATPVECQAGDKAAGEPSPTVFSWRRGLLYRAGQRNRALARATGAAPAPLGVPSPGGSAPGAQAGPAVLDMDSDGESLALTQGSLSLPAPLPVAEAGPGDEAAPQSSVGSIESPDHGAAWAAGSDPPLASPTGSPCPLPLQAPLGLLGGLSPDLCGGEEWLGQIDWSGASDVLSTPDALEPAGASQGASARSKGGHSLAPSPTVTEPASATDGGTVTEAAGLSDGDEALDWPLHYSHTSGTLPGG